MVLSLLPILGDLFSINLADSLHHSYYDCFSRQGSIRPLCDSLSYLKIERLCYSRNWDRGYNWDKVLTGTRGYNCDKVLTGTRRYNCDNVLTGTRRYNCDKVLTGTRRYNCDNVLTGTRRYNCDKVLTGTRRYNCDKVLTGTGVIIGTRC